MICEQPEARPLQPISLATSHERLAPVSTNGFPEATQPLQVSRYRVVIKVPTHYSGKPLPLNLDGFMTPVFQLTPDSQQRRTHTLFDSQSQYLEVTASADTTTVGEPRKSKVSGFLKPRFLRFITANDQTQSAVFSRR